MQAACLSILAYAVFGVTRCPRGPITCLFPKPGHANMERLLNFSSVLKSYTANHTGFGHQCSPGIWPTVYCSAVEQCRLLNSSTGHVVLGKNILFVTPKFGGAILHHPIPSLCGSQLISVCMWKRGVSLIELLVTGDKVELTPLPSFPYKTTALSPFPAYWHDVTPD